MRARRRVSRASNGFTKLISWFRGIDTSNREAARYIKSEVGYELTEMRRYLDDAADAYGWFYEDGDGAIDKAYSYLDDAEDLLDSVIKDLNKGLSDLPRDVSTAVERVIDDYDELYTFLRRGDVFEL